MIFRLGLIAFLHICLLFASFLLKANNANDQLTGSNPLADSLYSVLDKSDLDTLELLHTFESIRKNRRSLKSHYLPLLHKHVSTCEAVAYNYGAMKALDIIGLYLRYDEQYDSAIYYHNKSLSLNQVIKDSTQLYYNYNNLAQAYRQQDMSVQAISNFQKALSIAEAIGYEKAVSYTLNSLGASYVVQKDFEQAMRCFRASNVIGKKRDDQLTLSYNYGSIGEVFLMQGMIDSAMHYIVLSKKIVDDLGTNKGLGVVNHLLGQALFAKGDYTSARNKFNVAIKHHNKRDKKRYLALCYAYLGRINMEMGSVDSAYYFLNQGIVFANSVHSFENLIMIYDALFELNKQQGKWEKAVAALQQSHAYQDSIINIANNREIQSLSVMYATHKKEQQIKLLSAENQIKSQRIRLGIALIIALIMSVIAGIYFQVMRKKQTRFEQDKLKQQLMLSQMNPHFIFNALGSIQSYMYKNEAKKAAGFMGNFASLTRSILNNSSAESVSLYEEVETLKNYLSLEQMRMQGAFVFKFDIDESLDSEFTFIPPMMIQPFVENAIKHGINNIDYAGEIILRFKELENFIRVEVYDNGVGFNKTMNRIKDHESKATEIFQQRMHILQKSFKKIPPLQISDLSNEGKKGTNVVLYLPIMEE